MGGERESRLADVWFSTLRYRILLLVLIAGLWRRSLAPVARAAGDVRRWRWRWRERLTAKAADGGGESPWWREPLVARALGGESR